MYINLKEIKSHKTVKSFVKHLKSISPYRYLTEQGYILYILGKNYRPIEKPIYYRYNRDKPVFDKHGLQKFTCEIICDYDYYINDKVVSKENFINFITELLNSNPEFLIQLTPENTVCCGYCGKVLYAFNGNNVTLKDIKECNCEA